MIQDPSFSGNAQVVSIKAQATGIIRTPDSNSQDQFEWEIFVGSQPFGLTPGQVAGSSTNPASINVTADTLLHFSQSDGHINPNSQRSFTETYNFTSQTLTANTLESNLISAHASPFTISNGLFVQVFLFTGSNQLNMTLANIQLTVTLAIQAPNLSVTPFVSATASTSRPMVVTQTVTLSNTGLATSFTASIQGPGSPTIQPQSGPIGQNQTQTLTVTLNTTGLSAGVFTAIYTVSVGSNLEGPSKSAGKLAVTAQAGSSTSGQYAVTNNATLQSSPGSLTFNLTNSQPSAQTVEISDVGNSPICVTLTYKNTVVPQNDGVPTVVTPPPPTDCSISKTRDFIASVAASVGTMMPGTTVGGALTISCDTSTPCDAPLGLDVTIANNTPPATASQVFAHFADGGEWQTEFLLINPNPKTVSVTMRFHPDAPNTTLNIQSTGMVSSISNISIPPNGSAFYRTVGDPSVKTTSGWVEIISPLPLDGTALFRRHASDGKYYEGSTPIATPSLTFTLPYDGSTFTNTGALTTTDLAIANPNSKTSADVTCSAFDLNGILLGSNLELPSVGALGHMGLGLQNTAPVKSVIGNGRGILMCSSTASIAALGLRLLGTTALSSLPVITSPPPSNVAQIFPHYADSGGWQTEFLLINLNATTLSVTMRFHPDVPNTPLNIEGKGKVSSISNIIIPPNGSAFYSTVGDPSVKTLNSGWVQIVSHLPLDGVALFRLHGSDGKYYEGSIPLVMPSSAFTLPYDGTTFTKTAPLATTGLAIANPNSGTNANVACSAFDSNGKLLGSNLELTSLGALAHKESTLQTMFKSVIGIGRGTLTCDSTAPVGVLGLRFLGVATSSIPVITGN